MYADLLNSYGGHKLACGFLWMWKLYDLWGSWEIFSNYKKENDDENYDLILDKFDDEIIQNVEN